MRLCLLIDFGSTHTKVAAVDLDGCTLAGRARAPTTAGEDITLGLRAALDELAGQVGRRARYGEKLACSSAAGGLRLAAVGLVPELTAEAARRAALGAGARVVHVFSYRLGPSERDLLDELDPDVILLAGGTDGGNREVLLHNAGALAEAASRAPVVVAGNAEVAAEAARRLAAAGKDARVAPNVMPRLGRLEVEGAREAIRAVFLERIVAAKGLDRALALVDGVLMPTPAAVLEAGRLLAQGTGGEEGLGELVVLDIGGATTDVHSLAAGEPAEAGIERKGLPEPWAKRTVEGDLGVRVSAEAAVEAVGAEAVSRRCPLGPGEVAAGARALGEHPERLPQSEAERGLDLALARVCAHTAMTRHAGRLETLHTPHGTRRFQRGKDLRQVSHLVGTGGVIVHGGRPGGILEEALFSAEEPEVLRPETPRLWVDGDYLLAAAGLLARRHPDEALRLLKAHLRPAETSRHGAGRKETADGTT